MQAEKSIPVWLLGLCVLAFGSLSPWLGFYWDDWPLAWFIHVLGPEGFLGFAPQRPFSGVLYFLSSALLGTRPIAWQLYALVWRWVAAMLFWLLLRQLWPRRARMAVAGGILFALYPGFSQQSIALIYSLYFIYYSLFLASLVVMVKALKSVQQYWRLTAVGLLLSAAAMLSTEYFYGLELLRSLLVVVVILRLRENWRDSLVASFRYWLPYGLLVAGIFAWRFNVSSEVSYDINIFSNFAASPVESANYYTTTILTDVYEATLLAWGQVFNLADLGDFGARIFGLYTVVIILGVVLSGSVLWWQKNEKLEIKPDILNHVSPPLIALLALLIGGLSFWMTDLPLRLGYPWDRGFLPMAFGSVILMAWLLTQLLDWIRLPDILQIVLVSIVAGLSIGFQFETGTGYLRAWRTQSDLYQQLYWRAPNLARDTVVISAELKDLRFYTDNSLTGQLSWIYDPNYDPDTDSFSMPYFWNFVGEGWGSRLPEFKAEENFELDYRFFTFDGNTSRSIVVHNQPGQCLRVLNPAYDDLFPKLPEELLEPLAVSSPHEVIQTDGLAEWPTAQFGPEAEHEWCHPYQKADLARQMEDWKAVAEIGDEALGQYEPLHAAELVPFIIGYANLGDIEKAEALTLEAYAFKGDERMQPMLCAVWLDLANTNGDTFGEDIQRQLSCSP
ncbi:MAG: hypothetical protein D8M60_05305 [Chloroflexi bacterium]|nr:hypothetical protein [Chloroflexota bacterium]